MTGMSSCFATIAVKAFGGRFEEPPLNYSRLCQKQPKIDTIIMVGLYNEPVVIYLRFFHVMQSVFKYFYGT